jgi:hypothetical protein
MGMLSKPGGRPPEEIELARIVSLPLVGMPNEEETEIFCFESMLAHAYDRGERLWPTQVSAVDGYRKYGGGLLPIGVGWGKTGISLMCAESAYQKGLKKILLLIPPQQVSGLLKRHIPEWRQRVPMSVPFHFIAGRGASARRSIATSDAPGVYVFPYSLLSASDAIDLLTAIEPQLVIADEAHNLKNPRAARTKRLLHFLKELKPRPELIAMSGTITDKNISDYHHLAMLALRDNCPLPRLSSTCFFWGQILGADAQSPTTYAKSLMAPLLAWGRSHFPEETFRPDQIESYRRAYRHRLTTAPGVTATGDEEIGVTLRLENVEDVPEQNATLKELIRRVEDDMMTPQNEPIDHALHTFKWRYELSMGFYNALVWPLIEDLAKTRNVSEVEAELLLERAKVHLGYVKAYHAELRDFFKTSPPGLDTPREVGRSLAMHGDKFVGSSIHAAWRAMKEADFEGRPERYTSPVRVDDYKVKRIVQWAKETGRGLIWVFHQEAGRWIMDELTKAGLKPLYAPAGADDLIENAGDPGRGGKGTDLVVASMSSHGTGRNLQAFQHQIYAQWPRSAVLAEQSLGRTHRNGQQADELVVHTLLGPMFDHICRAATLQDAVYIQQTTGSRQKVVFCDYDPMPSIYSSEFLREQGTAPEMLTKEQRRVLASLFGPAIE